MKNPLELGAGIDVADNDDNDVNRDAGLRKSAVVTGLSVFSEKSDDEDDMDSPTHAKTIIISIGKT